MGVDGRQWDEYGISWVNKVLGAVRRWGSPPWILQPITYYTNYYSIIINITYYNSLISKAPTPERAESGEKKEDQTAYKPGSVPAPLRTRWMTIHLGRPLPDASRDRPGRRHGSRLPTLPPACRPYLVLLPVGFALPPPLPGARCALTAPFHPYRPSWALPPKPALAVCFLWHCPWGRPRRTLSGTVLPWSPDFPPRAGNPARSGHPAVWPTGKVGG